MVTMASFTFHVDPGHGWLEVSCEWLARVDLEPSDFSGYSYIGNFNMYLEEDCDMAIFLAAWRKRNNDRLPDMPLIQYELDAPIRQMARNEGTL